MTLKHRMLRTGQVIALAAVTQAACGNCGDPCLSPRAAFTYTCTDLTCDFTENCSDADGTVVAWSWDFGDGATSTARNPRHSYQTGRTYIVQLTARDNDDRTGSVSTSVALTPVTMTGDPTAAFTHSCSGLTCSFTDQSTDSDGTVVSRSWNFGDGNSSSSQNPTHPYAASGTYTVTLSVTDNDDRTGSVSHPVTVTVTVTGGGRILFVSDRTGNNHLYSMDGAGSDLVKITESPSSMMGGPRWSPDGTRIVFADGYRVYTIQSDGSDPRTVATGSVRMHDPAYSPDGLRIAFRRNQTLLIVGVDGTNETESGHVNLPQGGLEWSADGSSLWFDDDACRFYEMPDCEFVKNRIFGFDLASGGPLHYPALANYEIDSGLRDPAFSPDGRYLAFVAVGSGSSIHVYDLNTGNVQRVTALGGSDRSPAWSADGSRIVFVSEQDNNAEVYVMDRSGQPRQRLTNNPARDSEPDW